MPASSKPRKKKGRSVVERLAHARYQKAKAHAHAENMLIRLRNALPLGHEANRHKIDDTFGPLEEFLRQQELEGESFVNEKGEPLMWDEREQAYINVAEGIANMVFMFDVAAKCFGWDAQPRGLEKLGNKLFAGMVLFASDIAAARDAIAWMRANIAHVKPNEWSEVLEEADREIEAGMERRAARRNAA